MEVAPALDEPLLASFGWEEIDADVNELQKLMDDDHYDRERQLLGTAREHHNRSIRDGQRRLEDGARLGLHGPGVMTAGMRSRAFSSGRGHGR